MRHDGKDLYKPELFLTTIEKIPQMQELIDFIHKKIDDGETVRAKDDGTDVGYVMLDNEEMQKVFQPIFDKLKISHARISYVYIHYAENGCGFTVHDHDKPHAVYYLQVPMNCGHIYFPDFDDCDIMEPKEGKILIIPESIKHGISEHGNNALRIAITMQLENLI
ncbi:MAG: hypothetical protein OES15_04295 [Nitrosopumilus sp.]|nr:hypothetical protein [Nitrosopumilus sp.]MDH3780061.1 hypothetical protein [Nitrosopumilus sp.]MDH3853595.1 hypothetical protein [Nitrosopumilus sp.]